MYYSCTHMSPWQQVLSSIIIVMFPWILFWLPAYKELMQNKLNYCELLINVQFKTTQFQNWTYYFSFLFYKNYFHGNKIIKDIFIWILFWFYFWRWILLETDKSDRYSILLNHYFIKVFDLIKYISTFQLHMIYNSFSNNVSIFHVMKNNTYLL